MSPDVLVGAIVQLAVMLAVAGGYFAASCRYRILQHPISIVLFVTMVSVTVAVAGAVYRFGWEAVPAMVLRSAIGGFGWGVIIAAAAWAGRRVLIRSARDR
jgi:hypothetical protein